MNSVSAKRIRLWPLVLIVLLAVLGLVVIWLGPELPRQKRIERTGIILVASFFLFLIWLLFASRLRWKSRLGFSSLAIGIVGLCALLFEIRGVTGDLVPIFEFRWKNRNNPALAAAVVARLETNHPPITFSFPQFQGPSRNSVLTNVALEADWKQFPPQLLWRKPVGAAWSGFVVEGGRAITQEQRGEKEMVVCYDLINGSELWAHGDDARYNTTIAGEGPRTTPSIAGDLVFTVGGTGLLNCLDLKSGSRIWGKDLLKEHQAKLPDWGIAGSPLVVEDQVIVCPGGPGGRMIVSYDKDDGKLLWFAGEGGADYSSPALLDLMGEKQIVLFNTKGVNGFSLSGSNIWQYPWPGGHPHITLPLAISSNRVMVSSGYGTGTELIQLEREDGNLRASRVWKSIGLKSKFGNLFHHNGFVYGLDDGMFACLELATGKRQWKEGRYGHGQALWVGGTILMVAEKGDLVLIDPNPEKLVEIARWSVFEEKTWNPPCLAGEYLLVRSDKAAACYKIPLNEKKAKRIALLFAKWQIVY